MPTQNPSQTVEGLLTRAVQMLNADDAAGAENCLDRVLLLAPSQPVALYLKGVVHFVRGEWASAEQLFHKALELSPGQPRVAEHLAKAAINLASSLSQVGRSDQAQTVLKAALARVERGDDAQLSAARLHHALGLTQKTLRRFEESLASLNRAERLGGSNAAWPAGSSSDRRELQVCRAMVLQHLQRFDEAIAEQRSILARNPLDMDTHLQLNELLYRQKRDDLFLVSYDEAACAVPDSTLPYTAKGFLLLKAGRGDEARAAYERALGIDGGDPRALSGLARALEALGWQDEALALHDRSLKLHPRDCAVLVEAASARLRGGDAREAKALALRARSEAPADQGALAILGLCYRALADEREYELYGYDTLVQSFDLEPPEGFSDMASFNRELADYLDALQVDQRPHFTQTLRGGTRVYDEVFDNGHELINRLKRVIDRTVACYAASLTVDPAHPFLSRRTRSFRYSGSWSSRMLHQGFHVNHIHSQGWISSAYYVAVPEAAAEMHERQGWLNFGAPTADFGPAFTSRRAIQPIVGRLVLFPSYLWHGVTPFQSAESRTTIAFDAVPA